MKGSRAKTKDTKNALHFLCPLFILVTILGYLLDDFIFQETQKLPNLSGFIISQLLLKPAGGRKDSRHLMNRK